MTNFTALAEVIKRDRENGTPGPWIVHKKADEETEIGSGHFGDDGWPEWNVATCWGGMADGVEDANSRRIARLPALETAYLELWARVQALEGACTGLVKILNEHEGKVPLPDIALMFCWMAAQDVRAALKPPETDR